MMFGLKNTPTTFQHMAQEIFNKYLTIFMWFFLDDFKIFGKKAKHLTHLRQILLKCQSAQLSLNPENCAFVVQSGVLLGHVISKEGIKVNEKKVEVI